MADMVKTKAPDFKATPSTTHSWGVIVILTPYKLQGGHWYRTRRAAKKAGRELHGTAWALAQFNPMQSAQTFADRTHHDAIGS